MVSVLLLAGLCFGVTTAQAKAWRNAPFAEVQQAAEQGDADAQISLGYRYAMGDEVAQDDRQAVVWYRKAAEQGLVEAQVNLAGRYYNGKGVPQDYRQALTWFKKAAEQGDYFAQFRLGEMYAKGRGVAQDHELAYVWYSVAAANGWGDAVAERDTAAKELTPAVLADAQTLAGEYFEKYQRKR